MHSEHTKPIPIHTTSSENLPACYYCIIWNICVIECAGHQYRVRVRAVNLMGKSGFSGEGNFWIWNWAHRSILLFHLITELIITRYEGEERAGVSK